MSEEYQFVYSSDDSDHDDFASDDETSQVSRFFFQAPKEEADSQAHATLSSDERRFAEAGLLGTTLSKKPVYLNTHEPFCCVTVGVQGAGKSHTFCTVLENCLVPTHPPQSPGETIVKLNMPMAALAFHFDQCQNSPCEATGLTNPSPLISGFFGRHPNPRLAPEKMVVLVSPTFFEQRKAFYGDRCEVLPLLFSWSSLTAKQLKALMRIDESGSQLYVALLLDKLRRYQRDNTLPDFASFLAEIDRDCPQVSQNGPLKQRLFILETMIAESNFNEKTRKHFKELSKLFAPGTLVVCDLTDPLFSGTEDANAIFQVVLEQFKNQNLGCGKLVAMDEAHKYMNGHSSDGLSRSIVDGARLMRHDGMRMLVSTQSPHVLDPELLELVSVAVIHRFHSSDWFKYLSSKIPLPQERFEEIQRLAPGEAIVFAPCHNVPLEKSSSSFLIKVRPRLTEDRGASKRNEVAKQPLPSVPERTIISTTPRAAEKSVAKPSPVPQATTSSLSRVPASSRPVQTSARDEVRGPFEQIKEEVLRKAIKDSNPDRLGWATFASVSAVYKKMFGESLPLSELPKISPKFEIARQYQGINGNDRVRYVP